MRKSFFIVVLSSLCALPAWADDASGNPGDGLTLVAPGLWAVAAEGPPMWFTEGQYFSCSGGQWSATVGGDAQWTPVNSAQLPESVRDGLDAGRYANYGVCPGDPLPTPAATAMGGPSVVMVGGYPRILRVGPMFHGWRPSYAWTRPTWFPARPRVWGWARPNYGGGWHGYRGGGGFRGGWGGSRGWGGGHHR